VRLTTPSSRLRGTWFAVWGGRDDDAVQNGALHTTRASANKARSEGPATAPTECARAPSEGGWAPGNQPSLRGPAVGGPPGALGAAPRPLVRRVHGGAVPGCAQTQRSPHGGRGLVVGKPAAAARRLNRCLGLPPPAAQNRRKTDAADRLQVGMIGAHECRPAAPGPQACRASFQTAKPAAWQPHIQPREAP